MLARMNSSILSNQLEQSERILLLQAKSLISNSQQAENLHDAEFSVFSQWGDDGILQHLIHKIEIQHKTFVEFGVSNYQESNTRFLLFNNNWEGLVMDCSKKNIQFIQTQSWYWKYNLRAKQAFVQTSNINSLIEKENISGSIGLLHIDIDGNDYWIWEALDQVQPDIVSVEYNSFWGSERAITIPYEKDFQRDQANPNLLYSGASLLALCDLADKKGYVFVGCNSAGNDAYFVRKEKAQNLKILTPKEGFIKAKFREARNVHGELSYLTYEESCKLLKGEKVYNVHSKRIEPF